jgi:hypothetical protein
VVSNSITKTANLIPAKVGKRKEKKDELDKAVSRKRDGSNDVSHL